MKWKEDRQSININLRGRLKQLSPSAEEFVFHTDICFGNGLLGSKLLKDRSQESSLVQIFVLSKLSVGSQTERVSRSHKIIGIKDRCDPCSDRLLKLNPQLKRIPVANRTCTNELISGSRPRASCGRGHLGFTFAPSYSSAVRRTDTCPDCCGAASRQQQWRARGRCSSPSAPCRRSRAPSRSRRSP